MKNIEGNYNGKLGYRAMRTLEVQDREGWFVKLWKVKAPKEAYILHMCLAYILQSALYLSKFGKIIQAKPEDMRTLLS